MATVSAGTGIHRGHQHKPGGIGNLITDTRQLYRPVFQGLSQYFQRTSGEFGQLVKIQDPVVCQGYLTRKGRRPASGKRYYRCCMMRGPERPGGHQAFFTAGDSCNRPDTGGFHGLRPGQRRQYTRQTPGHKCFAGSGRPCHQNIVTSGRCHFQCPAGLRLSPYQRKVRMT